MTSADDKQNVNAAADAAQLSEGLKRLASERGKPRSAFGTRLRTAFLTGLLIVGPVTITLYVIGA
jgi:hypothetical protein